MAELADLEGRLREARVDNGDVLDPAAARTLCCDSELIPMVMNGPTRPIEVGREKRIVPPWLRRAVMVRDRGCAHPGCDRTPSWCQVHHIVDWARGGPTSLANSVMLCRHHHALHHATEWEIRLAGDGLPEFLPPAFIDPERVPRRHARMVGRRASA